MKRLVILGLTAALDLTGITANQAFAGWAIGNVKYLNAASVGGRGVTQVALNDYQGAAACTPTQPTAFAFYNDTPTGRAQFAMLLAAWQAGTQVGIAGTNGCTISSTFEDVSHVDVATSR